MTLTKFVLLAFISFHLHCFLCFNDEGALDIAAFNVQIFGIKKMADGVVRENLKKIILRYDIILIQEIRDSSGEAIKQLLSDVINVDSRYAMKLSGRLGRSLSKEQYAYIYRKDWVTPYNDYTYADPNEVFEREPYIVRFRSEKASIKDFAIAGIHTSPDNAEIEISNLAVVYDDIVTRYSLNDVIIMGDFNAGCTYVRSWNNIKLATDARFYWLFGNTADTTTKRSDCPYDRVVVAGDKLLSSIIPSSSDIFRFDEHYSLTQDQVEDISDHFPIYFQIRSQYEKDNIIDSNSIKVINRNVNTDLTSYNVYAMKKAAESLGYNIFCSYTKSGAYLVITVSKTAWSLTDVVKSLHDDFNKDFPDFVPLEEIYAAERALYDIYPIRYLPRGHGLYKTLFDYLKNDQRQYSIELECSLVDRSNPICNLQVNDS